MVGRDPRCRTAEIALKAAQTGHLVLSTLHTNSTSETLTRLQQMGIARWMISLRSRWSSPSVWSASCVPTVGVMPAAPPTCRTACGPARCPAGRQPGCEHCYHGYYGRLALFEVLPVTPGYGQGIVQGLNAIEIESLARARRDDDAF